MVEQTPHNPSAYAVSKPKSHVFLPKTYINERKYYSGGITSNEGLIATLLVLLRMNSRPKYRSSESWSRILDC